MLRTVILSPAPRRRESPMPKAAHVLSRSTTLLRLLPIFYRTTHEQVVSAVTRRYDDDLEPIRDMTIRY